jgi:hypothetical protein
MRSSVWLPGLAVQRPRRTLWTTRSLADALLTEVTVSAFALHTPTQHRRVTTFRPAHAPPATIS